MRTLKVLTEVSIEQLRTDFVDTGRLDNDTFQRVVDSSRNKSAIATWLTKKVVDRVIPVDQIDAFETYFDTFEKHKRQFPHADLNQYKSAEDVTAFVTKAREIAAEIERDPSKAKGVKKDDKFVKYHFGKAGNFSIYKIPKKEEGDTEDHYGTSCELGGNAKWCTANSTNRYQFDNYNKENPLYIAVDRTNPVEKYQFYYYPGREGYRTREPQIMDKENQNAENIFGKLSASSPEKLAKGEETIADLTKAFELIKTKDGKDIPAQWKRMADFYEKYKDQLLNKVGETISVPVGSKTLPISNAQSKSAENIRQDGTISRIFQMLTQLELPFENITQVVTATVMPNNWATLMNSYSTEEQNLANIKAKAKILILVVGTIRGQRATLVYSKGPGRGRRGRTQILVDLYGKGHKKVSLSKTVSNYYQVTREVVNSLRTLFPVGYAERQPRQPAARQPRAPGQAAAAGARVGGPADQLANHQNAQDITVHIGRKVRQGRGLEGNFNDLQNVLGPRAQAALAEYAQNLGATWNHLYVYSKNGNVNYVVKGTVQNGRGGRSTIWLDKGSHQGTGFNWLHDEWGERKTNTSNARTPEGAQQVLRTLAVLQESLWKLSSILRDLYPQIGQEKILQLL